MIRTILFRLIWIDMMCSPSYNVKPKIVDFKPFLK